MDGKKPVGERKVPVYAGLYSPDPVDEEIRLEGMTTSCRGNVPEGVIGVNDLDYPLRAPQQVGELFLRQGIPFVMPDGSPPLDCPAQVEWRDTDGTWRRQRDERAIRRNRFFERRGGESTGLVRWGEVLVPGQIHEMRADGLHGWKIRLERDKGGGKRKIGP